MEHLLLKYDLFYFLFSIWSLSNINNMIAAQLNLFFSPKHYLKFYLSILAAFILHLNSKLLKGG